MGVLMVETAEAVELTDEGFTHCIRIIMDAQFLSAADVDSACGWTEGPPRTLQDKEIALHYLAKLLGAFGSWLLFHPDHYRGAGRDVKNNPRLMVTVAAKLTRIIIAGVERRIAEQTAQLSKAAEP